MRNGYEVKKIKTIRGHDGDMWNCTLYLDGKPVLDCMSDGWGGPNSYELATVQKVSDPGQYGRDFRAAHRAHSEAALEWCKQNEGWWTEFITPDSKVTMYDEKKDGEIGVAYSGCNEVLDWFVGVMMDGVNDVKTVNRIMAKHIIAKKEDGKMLQWKRLPKKVGALARAGRDAAIKDSIRDRFPAALIINDLPVAEAISHLIEG